MSDSVSDIAIVGAGPGGAHLASLAAGAGWRVLLFDPKGAWEKPCGGGVTSRGLKEYSFLTAAAGHPHNRVNHLLVVSSADNRVSVDLKYPFAVYSRAVLNDLVLQRAIDAGAQFIKEKIVGFERDGGDWVLKDGSGGSWRSRYLVGADGAASLIRRHLIGMFPARDTALAMGYNVVSTPISGAADRRKANTVVVEFVKDFSGYLWAFPRVGGINFGIASKLREQTSQALRHKLDEFVTENLQAAGLSAARSDFFAAKIPILDKATWKDLRVSGDGWALVGDAAGFVDPITGEGIYYALKSADLLFSALSGSESALAAKRITQAPAVEGSIEATLAASDAGAGQSPDVWNAVSAAYESNWRGEFGAELERASQILRRFYRGRFLGRDFNDAMVIFSRFHPGIRNTMARAVVGEQSYISLKKDLVRSLFRPFSPPTTPARP